MIYKSLYLPRYTLQLLYFHFRCLCQPWMKWTSPVSFGLYVHSYFHTEIRWMAERETGWGGNSCSSGESFWKLFSHWEGESYGEFSNWVSQWVRREPVKLVPSSFCLNDLVNRTCGVLFSTDVAAMGVHFPGLCIGVSLGSYFWAAKTLKVNWNCSFCRCCQHSVEIVAN